MIGYKVHKANYPIGEGAFSEIWPHPEHENAVIMRCPSKLKVEWLERQGLIWDTPRKSTRVNWEYLSGQQSVYILTVTKLRGLTGSEYRDRVSPEAEIINSVLNRIDSWEKAADYKRGLKILKRLSAQLPIHRDLIDFLIEKGSKTYPLDIGMRNYLACTITNKIYAYDCVNFEWISIKNEAAK